MENKEKIDKLQSMLWRRHGKLSEITNINAYSKSFDFLANEPEIYSTKDIKDK